MIKSNYAVSSIQKQINLVYIAYMPSTIIIIMNDGFFVYIWYGE